MKLYKTLFIKLALQSFPFATSEVFFSSRKSHFLYQQDSEKDEEISSPEQSHAVEGNTNGI